MIVTYNNNTFGFPARFPVTVPVPAVALTVTDPFRNRWVLYYTHEHVRKNMYAMATPTIARCEDLSR